MFKPTIAVCAALLIAPITSYSDDAQTETLHNNTYQQYVQVGCNSNYCEAQFAPTEHVSTVINAVSCSLPEPTGTLIVSVSLGTVNAAASYYLPIFINAVLPNGYTSFGVSSQTTFFVSKGDSPLVRFSTNSVASIVIYCLISGYHS